MFTSDHDRQTQGTIWRYNDMLMLHFNYSITQTLPIFRDGKKGAIKFELNCTKIWHFFVNPKWTMALTDHLGLESRSNLTVNEF
jgi:hypothetical protein